MPTFTSLSPRLSRQEKDRSKDKELQENVRPYEVTSEFTIRASRGVEGFVVYARRNSGLFRKQY